MKRAIPRPVKILLILFLVLLVMCIGGYIAIDIQPSLGAQGADMLRNVFGTEAVAWLEGVVFQVQDTVHQLEYSLGAKPAAPWSAVSANITSPSARFSPASPTATSTFPLTTPEITREPTVSPSPTLTATPVRWPPASIPAIGTLPGEGQWASYFTDSYGHQVAYRTFVQPDPERPLTIAAIVAIDLAQTRLHYVLGFTEPTSYINVYRTGKIPQEDRKPGVLLAVFNGGFQTRHGNYGVMVDGQTLMTMRDGLGTLAIFQDDRVQIGVWGTDFTSYDGITVLRQNGPMIIQGGTINPQTGKDLPEYWGYTVHGEVATWRSAVGLSADGKTLYYAVGSSMTISALAQALKAAGVDSAIQLDINNYWILFCTVRFENNVPTSLPLLDIWKNNYNSNRYLFASARDYFYVTAAVG
ncbi:MAG: phosphodiester glycosidase family protein [Anaerolineales bacterium]